MRGMSGIFWIIFFIILLTIMVSASDAYVINGNTEDPLIGVIGPTSQMDRIGNYFIWFFTNTSDEITVFWSPEMDDTDKYEEIAVIRTNSIKPQAIDLVHQGFLIFVCDEEKMILILGNYKQPTIEIMLTFIEEKIQLSNGGVYNELNIPVLLVNLSEK